MQLRHLVLLMLSAAICFFFSLSLFWLLVLPLNTTNVSVEIIEVSNSILSNFKISVKRSYRRRVLIDVCTVGQVDENWVHILHICDGDGKIGQSGERLGFILILKSVRREKC